MIYLIVITGILLIAVVVLIVVILKYKNTRECESVMQSNQPLIIKGMNVETGYSQNLGLKGFGEDTSGTLLIGTNQLRPAFVIEFINKESGAVHRKTLKTRLVIGRRNVYEYRDEEYMLINDSASISKMHAELCVSGNEIYIRDCGSKNHTYINGKMLTNIKSLKNGDNVRFGQSEYNFYIKYK